jgi:hypothetical protein
MKAAVTLGRNYEFDQFSRTRMLVRRFQDDKAI